MTQPGVSGRKHQANPWGFEVGNTEDPKLAILPLKNRFWQHMKAFKMLQKWLALKHSSS